MVQRFLVIVAKRKAPPPRKPPISYRVTAGYNHTNERKSRGWVPRPIVARPSPLFQFIPTSKTTIYHVTVGPLGHVSDEEDVIRGVALRTEHSRLRRPISEVVHLVHSTSTYTNWIPTFSVAERKDYLTILDK